MFRRYWSLRYVVTKPSLFCRRYHVEHQNRPHAVVTETFPKLREEQGGQSPWMAANAGAIIDDFSLCLRHMSRDVHVFANPLE